MHSTSTRGQALRRRRLVLASGSRYRAELMQRLGLPFIVQAPAIDETPYPDEEPAQLVQRLATDKARAVAASYPDALIIGSDQIGNAGGTILCKPGDEQSAIEQLTAVSGNTVSFLTGLSLIDAETGSEQVDKVEVKVRFRDLSAEEIHNYIDRDKPLDCAGSFRVEGLGISLFDAVEGDDPTALQGLPLILLCRMLRQAGMNPLLF